MLNRRSLAVCAFLPVLAITYFAQSQATVTDAGARLFKEPNPGAPLLKPLPSGTEIDIDNAFLDRHWTRVSAGGLHGWVRREKIRIKMDDPWKQAVWLYIGRTPETNGFTVRFYLNTSQIVRNKDNIRFWTKMVPDNKEPYFDFIMENEPKHKPADFRYNSELWEGDCDSDELFVIRSLFYWKSGEVTRPNVNRGSAETSANTAAKVILREACDSADRQF